MKGSELYGQGNSHSSTKSANSPAKMQGEGGDSPAPFLGKLGGKIKGAMKKGGAGALIGGALLGPLGAAAGAALQRRRNKKKAAAGGGMDDMAAQVQEAAAAKQAAAGGGAAAAADPAAAAAVDPAAAAAPPVTMKRSPAKHLAKNPGFGTDKELRDHNKDAVNPGGEERRDAKNWTHKKKGKQ